MDRVANILLQSSRRLAWKLRPGANCTNARIIGRYLRTHNLRKLHIGCGGHVIPGWLNADLFPWSVRILHLDATKAFPVGDREIDYVFSEHMIEHVSYSQGLRMLSECYRVMRNGGIIRISTPNLEFLVDLYKENKSALQKEYIKWETSRFIHFAPYEDATFVINNFVRNWGHEFIYDERILVDSLKRAGFNRIARCELNKSRHDALTGLENEGRMPPGFLKLETLCVEASK